MAVFHSTPLRVPGRRRDSRPCDGSVLGLPVYYLISAVVGGVEVRPPLGDIGRALLSRSVLILQGHPGVAPWLSHAGLAKFEGGASSAFLRQGCPFGEGRRKVELGQVELKRPAVDHLLAASDAGLRDPGEHEAVLVHSDHVPCPEQYATRKVVLEREDPGALL